MQMTTVTYHREGPNWWAESSAIPGWTAAAATIDHLRTLAREGVEFATGKRARTRTAFWIGETSPPLRVDPAGNECFDLEEN